MEIIGETSGLTIGLAIALFTLMGGGLVWLIRLEGRVGANERAVTEHLERDEKIFERLDERFTKFENLMTQVLQDMSGLKADMRHVSESIKKIEAR